MLQLCVCLSSDFLKTSLVTLCYRTRLVLVNYHEAADDDENTVELAQVILTIFTVYGCVLSTVLLKSN